MDTHRWYYLFHRSFSFVLETYLQCLNRVLGFGRGVYRERRPLEVYPRSTIVEDENTMTRSEVIKLPMKLNDTCFDVCSSVGEHGVVLYFPEPVLTIRGWAHSLSTNQAIISRFCIYICSSGLYGAKRLRVCGKCSCLREGSQIGSGSRVEGAVMPMIPARNGPWLTTSLSSSRL